MIEKQTDIIGGVLFKNTRVIRVGGLGCFAHEFLSTFFR